MALILRVYDPHMKSLYLLPIDHPNLSLSLPHPNNSIKGTKRINLPLTPKLPPQQDVSEGYRERYIHSEILKKYPSIHSVVHSHSEAVLPYSISGVEMKPCFHVAGFLGKHTPPNYSHFG